MAIQIDEKLLSDDAKHFLNNTKNKSRLLREALEFYIRNVKGGMINTESSIGQDVVNDIKEIKDMLQHMTNEYKPISMNEASIDVQVKEVQIQEPIKENKRNTIQEEITKELPIEINNEKNSLNDDDGMTDEQKREIEKLLDNSLNNFI